MRLVPLNGTAVPTAPCDDVHFGGVELFREGVWGRICPGRFGGDEADFTLDAKVVCRQLGFPFGTVMDASEVSGFYDYSYSSASSDTVTVWATQVCHICLHWRSQCPECQGHCSWMLCELEFLHAFAASV